MYDLSTVVLTTLNAVASRDTVNIIVRCHAYAWMQCNM